MRHYRDKSCFSAFCSLNRLLIVALAAYLPSNFIAQSNTSNDQVILSLQASLRNAGVELSGIDASHEKFIQCAKDALTIENLDCYRLENDSRPIGLRLGVDCQLILKSKYWMRTVHGVDIKCATLLENQPLEIIYEDGVEKQVRIDKQALIKR
jgi:hypothetical protein